MDRPGHGHRSACVRDAASRRLSRRAPGFGAATLGPAAAAVAAMLGTALPAQVPAPADARPPSGAAVPDTMSSPLASGPDSAAATRPAFWAADSGTYVYVLVPEVSDNIRSAIDRSVAHMNFIIRPIARRRLLKANRLFPNLTFVMGPDSIAVTFTGMNPIVTPKDGGAAPWVRGSTGEHYDVYASQVGDTLRQVIATDDGQRENDFVSLEDGERIDLHVTLSADRLPTPCRYTLVFRRVREDRPPPPDGPPAASSPPTSGGAP